MYAIKQGVLKRGDISDCVLYSQQETVLTFTAT